jgi:nucleoside-diphosphate-sugar epimerase
MIDAFTLAAEASGVNGRIFNVGGPQIMPLRDMVETFARGAGFPVPTLHLPMSLGYLAGWGAELAFHAANREPPLSRRSIAFFRSNNAWNISAARNELGFEPRIDLDEGVRRTLAGSPELHIMMVK